MTAIPGYTDEQMRNELKLWGEWAKANPDKLTVTAGAEPISVAAAEHLAEVEAERDALKVAKLISVVTEERLAVVEAERDELRKENKRLHADVVALRKALGHANDVRYLLGEP